MWTYCTVLYISINMKSFVLTTRSRKIHPFNDNNNHVSAAQLWKYPEWEGKKEGRTERQKKDMSDLFLWHLPEVQTELSKSFIS